MKMQFDDISKEYGKLHETPLFKHFYEFSLLQLVGDVTGKSVLDLGCGEGHYTRRFKAMGATLVVGVDISTKMIEVAKGHEQKKSLGIDYFASDMADLRHASNFDVVCMMLSLHYATDEDHLLKMCQVAYDHLKPGGQLVAILSPRQPSRAEFDFRELGFSISYLNLESGVATAELKLYLPENPDQAPEIATFRLFDKATVEHCLEKVGCCQIEWHSSSVSPHSGYAEDFWKGIVESELFQGVVCAKEKI